MTIGVVEAVGAVEAIGRAELETETLEACRTGDPKALRRFVVRYEPVVFAFLSRTLGPGPHVEDLAQEVFLKAFRAVTRFVPDGPARASTWLLTIATRVAIDARKRKRVPIDPFPAGVDPVDPAQELVLNAILAAKALDFGGHRGVFAQCLAQYRVEAHAHAGPIAMLDNDGLAGRKGLLAHDRGAHRPAGAMEWLPGRIGTGRNEQSLFNQAVFDLGAQFGDAVLLRAYRKDG